MSAGDGRALRLEDRGVSTPTSRQELPMSEKPISPLRQRMLEDMSMRRFVPDTQREYIRAVKRLAIFLGRSPDTATPEELRAFQLHLTETGVQPPTISATVTAPVPAISTCATALAKTSSSRCATPATPRWKRPRSSCRR